LPAKLFGTGFDCYSSNPYQPFSPARRGFFYLEIRMIDLYQDVTDRIVAAIEAGTRPWVKPWSISDFRPRNAATQRPYRGVNRVLLGLEADAKGYADSRWLTFRQATELGARVRGGEHGTTVVFYKLTELPKQSADRTAIQYRKVPLLRSFTVFNVAQIDGLPESMTKQPEPAAWDAHVEADALLYSFGAEMLHARESQLINSSACRSCARRRGLFLQWLSTPLEND